jgi:hypothetical protein
MAWNAPITFVANAVLTAAQLNAQVRDNMSETAPAKATAANRIIVTTGANAVEEREIVEDYVDAEQTISSGGTTYGDISGGTVGPTVTLTTGTKALVLTSAHLKNAASGGHAWASFAISGATTDAATDERAVLFSADTASVGGVRAGVSTLVSLTAGTNTFTMKYKRSGTTGNASFGRRRIQVVAL